MHAKMHTRLHVTYFTCDAYQSAYAACTQTCEPQGVSIACRHVCRNTRDAYRWSCIAVCEVVRRDAFSHAGPNGCKHARVLTFNCRRPAGGPLEARWRSAGGPLEARWRPAGGPLSAQCMLMSICMLMWYCVGSCRFGWYSQRDMYLHNMCVACVEYVHTRARHACKIACTSMQACTSMLKHTQA